MVAFIPIRATVNTTVREALNDSGIKILKKKTSTQKPSRLPLWMKIAVENILRNKKRSALSIFNLVLGLALFSVSLNVSNSIENSLVATSQRQLYDLSIVLDKQYNREAVLTALNEEKGVEKIEFWERAKASILYENKRKRI